MFGFKTKNFFIKFNTFLISVIIGFICPGFSQSKTSGNTIVHGPREIAIFKEHSFIYGGNGIIPGIVGTKRNIPTYFSFAGNSGVAAVSDAAHVDGYVKNYVHQNFTFPIGDNGLYCPISMISSNPVATPVSAAYFNVNPDIAITSSLMGGNEPPLPVGAPFAISSRETGISKVSNIEYWDVDGSSPVKLRLLWRSSSQIPTLTNSMLITLRIVGWDGSKWVDIPSTLDAGADLTSGSITTSTPIVPNAYFAYTFGASCDMMDVTVTGIPEGIYLCKGETLTIDVGVMLTGSSIIPEYLLERWDGSTWVSASSHNNDGVFSFSSIPDGAPNERYRVRINFGSCTRLSDEFELHSYKITTLACNSNIHSTVDHNCEMLITSSMFLTNVINPPGFYDITIRNSAGKTISNPVVNPENGEVFMVSIIERCTGNKCWGTIKVEDKLAPVISDCIENQTFACHEFETIKSETVADHFSGTGRFTLSRPPEVLENCNQFKAEFIDDISWTECSQKRLTRKWQFTDLAGNTSTCQQIFNFTPMQLGDFNDPVAQVVLDCKSAFNPTDILALFDDQNTKDSIRSTGIVENNEGARFAGFTFMARGADGALHPQTVKDHICNISTTFTDEQIATDGCSKEKKILRKWLILENCTNAFRFFNQYIILKDTTGPQFTVSPVKKSMDDHHCYATINIPPPALLSDDCSDVTKIKWHVIPPEGAVVKGTQPHYIIEGLTKGSHTLIYVMEDCAGNQTRKSTTIQISDLVPPTSISKQTIVVSLSDSGDGRGYAKLFAAAVDNGSFDQCGPVRLEIRRKKGNNCANQGKYGHNNNLTFSHRIGINDLPATWSHPENNSNDSDGGEYVTFCCEDIMTGMTFGLHEVELRVWDDANNNGIIGDTLIIDGVRDNYNTVWSNVRVEFKIPPVMVCPKDLTLQCDDPFHLNTASHQLITGKLSTGMPTIQALCKDSFAISYQDKWLSGGICNTGQLQRTFRLYETSITCVQNIKLIPHTTPFEVSFAEAGTVTWDKCEFTLDDAKNAKLLPKITSSPCALIGQKIIIDTFYFNGGACKKWLVSYSYHNHCTGQTLDAPVMTYIYNDTIAPAVVLNHEIKGQSSDCASDVMIKARLSDITNCGGNQRLSSEALLDVNGDNTIDYVSSYRLHHLVLQNSWTRIKIGHVDYSRLQSLFPNINFAEEINVSYMQPIKGKDSLIWLHPLTLENTGLINKLLWKVTDDCGNNSSQIYEFRVMDQKPPSPVCIELSTSLTSGDVPSVELWARDFVKDVSDDCTPETEILYTFDALGPIPSMRHTVHYYKKGHDGNAVIATKAQYESGDAQKWLPEKNTSGKVWLKSGILNVPVYVWDQQGNVNHCTVKLTIINTDDISSYLRKSIYHKSTS
jgi:hypothetical protein